MKFSWLFGVGLLATLCAAPVQGDLVFFSTVGPPVASDPSDPYSVTVAPQPLTIGGAPTISGAVGETSSLHVWLSMDNLPRNKYISVALDVVSSDANVAHGTEFVWHNPENFTSGQLRWNGSVSKSLNPVGNPQWMPSYGNYAYSVTATGIGNSLVYKSDVGRDDDTGAFYLGRLDFQIDQVGSTGLYFRNGGFKSLVINTTNSPHSTGALLQFGDLGIATPHDGRIVGAGDPITLDLEYADAFIVGYLPTNGVPGANVPEPSTLALAAVGVLGLAFAKFRRVSLRA